MKRSTASNISRLALEARYAVLHQIAKLFQNLLVPHFSGEVGVAPGIIVGRLQHDGLLGYHHMNHLKERFARVPIKSEEVAA